MTYLQNSTICYACRRKKHWSNLGYDIYTMKTYCLDRRVCPSAYQPNHKLVPANYEEVVEEIELVYPEEIAQAFKNEFGKPRSMRLTPAQIMFLFKYGQRNGASSFSDVLSQIIEAMMMRDENEELDDDDLIAIPWKINQAPASKRFGKRVDVLQEKRKQLEEEIEEEEEELEDADEDAEGELTL